MVSFYGQVIDLEIFKIKYAFKILQECENVMKISLKESLFIINFDDTDSELISRLVKWVP